MHISLLLTKRNSLQLMTYYEIQIMYYEIQIMVFSKEKLDRYKNLAIKSIYLS